MGPNVRLPFSHSLTDRDIGLPPKIARQMSATMKATPIVNRTSASSFPLTLTKRTRSTPVARRATMIAAATRPAARLPVVAVTTTPT